MALSAVQVPGSGGSVGSNVTVTNFPTTQPVSGTVTANQGTSPWVENISQFGGTNVTIGQQLASASIPVILPSATITTLTPPSNAGYALDSSLTTIDTDIKSNITLHAGSAIIGKVGIDQTTPGTTNAVAIQDGAGNALTSNSTTFTAKKALDGNLLGTLGTAFSTAGKVDVKAADGDVFVRQATAANLNATVVGTGTFAVQATLQTQTDTVMVGGVNIKEINAVTPLMGNGVTGTGSLRVTVASDNTAFSIKNQDGAGNALTTNSTTFSSKFALDSNILGTLGTAFTDAGKVNVQGGVATNTAVADKLLNIGVQGVSSENSAVTTGRMVQLVADLVGKQIVLPYANPENFVSGRATATDTTSTSLIGAPAAGLRNYLTQITVWNSSATSTYIKIQDGSGGTELYDIPAPAGGGATLTLPTPLRQPTTATAIFFAANASANAVFVSASGYKGV